MRLYLIHGRGTGSKARSFEQRRTALSVLRYRPFRPLLFDARLLSQELTVPDRHQVELTQLLGRICRRLIPIAQRQQIVLTFQIPSQPLVVHGKRIILDWIFSTFVDYVLNGTPAYGTVSLGVNSDSDGNYCMSIMGAAPPSILNFLSVSYPEVDDNLTRKICIEKHRGFSTAKLLLVLHGGSVTVKKQENLGTNIKVWLPLGFGAPT